MNDARSASPSHHIDAEYALQQNPHDHKSELRLWLRLLTCANLIEAEIRKRLREQFDTTLPRFDLMAQLDRAENGILLGELSQRMMVSNGNVTGLVERLVQEGLIERQVTEHDRRAVRVRMTEQGRAAFSEMAAAHGDWISEMLGELSETDRERLWGRLGNLKKSVRNALGDKKSGRSAGK